MHPVCISLAALVRMKDVSWGGSLSKRGGPILLLFPKGEQHSVLVSDQVSIYISLFLSFSFLKP